MKAIAKTLLRKAGYEVRARPARSEGMPEDGPSAYQLCVFSLIAGLPPGETLRCVEIGANDGRTNDPLYDVTRRFPDRTRLLLIEPQAQLIPYLRDNLAFHPDARIENVAVGAPGTLTLYGVKQEVWPRLDVPYARSWPTYRAPTGVVSGDRAHVMRWLEGVLPKPLRPEDAILRFEVPCVSLDALVEGWSADGRIDVLQIDTEGFDDQILLDCDLARLGPKVIFFEISHISRARQEAVMRFLEAHGYLLTQEGADMVAIGAGRGAQAVPASA